MPCQPPQPTPKGVVFLAVFPFVRHLSATVLPNLPLFCAADAVGAWPQRLPAGAGLRCVGRRFAFAKRRAWRFAFAQEGPEICCWKGGAHAQFGSSPDCIQFLSVLAANVDEGLRGYLTKYDCSSADINPIGADC